MVYSNRLLEKQVAPFRYSHLYHKQKNRTSISRSPILVPYDILFSNEYLRDLGRIWELREIVPDPNNMPWIEKIDK